MRHARFGRYVLMFSSLLLSACWDYVGEHTSCIHFANTGEVGICYATISNHADRTDHHRIGPAANYFRCDDDEFSAVPAPVIMKRLYRVAPYLLWLDADSSIVLCWDLSVDTVGAASRWLDSAAWKTDTVFRFHNPAGKAIYEYHHTFTFRPEDVANLNN